MVSVGCSVVVAEVVVVVEAEAVGGEAVVGGVGVEAVVGVIEVVEVVVVFNEGCIELTTQYNRISSTILKDLFC